MQVWHLHVYVVRRACSTNAEADGTFWWQKYLKVLKLEPPDLNRIVVMLIS
jgi:hypothetical protein